MGMLFRHYIRFERVVADDAIAFEPLANLCSSISQIWRQEIRLLDSHSRLVSLEYWIDHFDHHDTLNGRLESQDIDKFMDVQFESTACDSSWLYILEVMGAEFDLVELEKCTSANKFVAIQDANRPEVEQMFSSLSALGIESSLSTNSAYRWIREHRKFV